MKAKKAIKLNPPILINHFKLFCMAFRYLVESSEGGELRKMATHKT